jgi:hypothetical protein
LLASLWAPECPVTWALLDKNHPTTALVFDMTGLMVLLGAGTAVTRGFRNRADMIPGLPGPDWLALGLITGVILFGFVLEGMRIAMTGWPEGAWYAVIGYGISLIFSESPLWTEVYGYLWYAHAVLTAGFVAYLPFSRMSHLLVAPVVLILNALRDSESGQS